MTSSSFRDLRVWQAAMRLASEIYRETANFPKHATQITSSPIFC